MTNFIKTDNQDDEVCDFDVLTSFSVMEQGQPYPFKSQISRIQAYDLLTKMSDNEHKALVREELKIAYPDDVKEIRLILTNQYDNTNEALADLEYGENPDFQASEQTAIDDLIKQLDFNDVIACFDSHLKTYGNAVLKLRRENNIVYIDNIDPRFWFPVIDPMNAKNILGHIIAFDYTEDKKKYVKFEIHTADKVETRIHLIKNDKIDALINIFEANTGINEPTIIWQKLNPKDIIFSDSDFQKYASIVTSMEVELSKIGYNLDKQGKIIYGPDTALELDPKTNQYVLRKGKYMALHDNEAAPGVITFDAQITASIDYVNKLQEQYYISSGTSAALYALGSINAPSGTALKRLLQRPLSKASKLVERIKPRLEKALQLASILNGKELKNITSNWKDGLVGDETEDTTNYNTRVMGGWMSKKSAIMKMENIDDKAAEKELVQIDTEKQAETVKALDVLYPPDTNNPNDSGNPDNLNNNTDNKNIGNK